MEPKPGYDALEARCRRAEAALASLRSERAAASPGALFEASHAAMLLIDPESGGIVDANDAAAEFYGWPRETLTGMNIADLNTLNDAEIRAEMEKARSLARCHFHFRHRRADGSTRDVAVRSGPVRIGGRDFLHSIVWDATASLASHTELWESERRFRLFMEHSPAVSWIKDATGRHVFVNDRHETFFGRPAADWLGRTCEEILPPEIAEAFRRNDRRTMAEGRTMEFVEEAVDREGNRRSFRVQKFPFRSADGKAFLGGMALDISERRRVEAALRQSERRLREAQRIARIASYERNLDTGEGYWSDEHYRLLGYAPGGVDHSFDFFLSHIHAGDRARARRILTEAHENLGSFAYDCRFVRQDGEVRHAHHTGECVPAEDGKSRWLQGTFQDITERKRIETALRESLSRYRAIFEKSPVGMVRFGRDGAILDCNGAFVELMGSSKEKLVGFAAGRNSPAGIRPAIRRAIAGETAGFEEEFTSVTGGKTLFLRAIFNPVHPGESSTEAIGVFEDFTERKRAEDERRKSEEKFRLLTEASPMGIWIGRNERFVYGNPAFARMAGCPAEALLGTPLLDSVHPDFREKARERMEARRKGETDVFRYEIKGLRSSGESFWTDLSTVLIDFDEGPAVLGIAIDVSDRKCAERELRESQAMLARTEHMAEIGSWEWDAASDRIAGSRELHRILGLEPGEGTMPFDGLSGKFAPGDFERLKRAASEALRTRAPFELELDLLRPGGEIRHCAVRGEARRGSENGSEGEGGKVSGSLQDVTERKRAEETLRIARRAAESASRAKSEFIANMSHELRTPLNAILGHAQLLARDPSLSESHREGAGVVEQSGLHLLALIEDVLDISRIEVGGIPMALHAMDLRKTIADVADMVRHEANRKGLGLRRELDPDLPAFVLADSRRLRQVLLNLLANAVKFTARGEVAIRAFSEGDRVVFAVSDTGPGIPEDRRASVFDAFQQLETSTGGTPKGAGLGLTISRTLVESMGGELVLESTVGEGSEFRFAVRLPAADGPDGSASAPVPEGDAAGVREGDAFRGDEREEELPALVSPSRDALEALSRMVRAGDISGIRKRAALLRESEPETEAFCGLLLRRGADYDFEGIAELLARVSEGSG